GRAIRCLGRPVPARRPAARAAGASGAGRRGPVRGLGADRPGRPLLHGGPALRGDDLVTVRLLLVLLLALVTGGAALAQGVVTATSHPTTRVQSTFAGETITLFGNIEPDASGELPPGPYDVVVVLRGPAADRVVRQKSRQFGLILNSDYALYENLPSFYRVLSSRPLSALADEEVLEAHALTLEGLAGRTLAAAGGTAGLFAAELVRLVP